MFMFRPRRNALVKRLWRQQQQVGGGGVTGGSVKAAAHALFKRLSDDQLAALVDAVDAANAKSSPCLHLDPDTLNKSCQEAAHVILCRIFRWPELDGSGQLKRVISLCTSSTSSSSSSSTSSSDSTSICCNPYHWSRLSPSDAAPVSYSRLLMNLERPVRVANSFSVESLETGGTNQFSSSTNNLDGRVRPWCTLAYWELRERVGRLFPVSSASVAIFSDVKAQAADGLCLSALTAHRPPQTDAVRRTRQKVALGLLLSQESDGVWMYNRSESALFVNSPTLDPRSAPGSSGGAPRTLLVYKVPPTFAIRIFDYERSLYDQLVNHNSLSISSSHKYKNKSSNNQHSSTSSLWKCQFQTGALHYRCDDVKVSDVSMENLLNLENYSREEFNDGPYDPNALRISFAKGWGPKYSRQFITSCPCWIEVLLSPHR